MISGAESDRFHGAVTGDDRSMITVIFATRNGMSTLPSVLTAYCQLETPAGGWKLIVVDNASTDATRDIINSFRDRLPVTYLYEKKPGKNAALNTALDHVAGDLLLLTDDDVFPRPNWLVCMRKAADSLPAYSVFGGAVLPHWEVTPPDWIVEWVPGGPVFTLTPPSMPEGPMTPGSVYGPNMAVRTEIFRQGFRFDPTIGPQGANYAMGSETEFVVRLARHGHSAWHVPNAVVEHFIRDFQLHRSWILRRAIRFGRGHYRMTHTEERRDISTWRGIPRHLFKQMFVQTVLVLKGLACLDDETVFRARWTFNVMWGQMIEARKLRGQPASA
jgi:glycosyltransferase involved in cell wall biosynthesis